VLVIVTERAILTIFRSRDASTPTRCASRREPHPTTLSSAALRSDKTLAELSEQLALHPNQIIQFRQHALEDRAELFEKDKAPKPSGVSGDDLKDLHAKIVSARSAPFFKAYLVLQSVSIWEIIAMDGLTILGERRWDLQMTLAWDHICLLVMIAALSDQQDALLDGVHQAVAIIDPA
jgi:hypothetical protein